MIRNWMGQNTEENFYALADKYGLMVWNDFWESTQTYNLEAEDPALFLKNARDTILRYRHHPSIVVWCGRNEGVPQPTINEGLAALVRTLDHTRYYTGSSNQVNLRNSGPYQFQPLETYYRINRGFSVELGIPSVPTLESMKSFIPEPDRWPISDTWAYHDWHQSGNGAVQPYHGAHGDRVWRAHQPGGLRAQGADARLRGPSRHLRGLCRASLAAQLRAHDLDDAAGVAKHGVEFPELGLRHAIQLLRDAEGMRADSRAAQSDRWLRGSDQPGRGAFLQGARRLW